ncbi:hypothetical protein V1511DRAFT_492765 [Dipodascopsis uninucleata]
MDFFGGNEDLDLRPAQYFSDSLAFLDPNWALLEDTFDQTDIQNESLATVLQRGDCSEGAKLNEQSTSGIGSSSSSNVELISDNNNTSQMGANSPSDSIIVNGEKTRPAKRKPHRKSRTGCRTCKKRRVKCDETHPRCLNCSNLGLTCSFLSASAMFQNVTAMATTGMGVKGDIESRVIDPLGLAEIQYLKGFGLPGSIGEEIHLEDFRLFYTYNRFVVPSLSGLVDNGLDTWETFTPQLAFKHPVLLHSLLALAGSYLTEHAKESSVETRARYHRSRALKLLRTCLEGKLDETNTDFTFLSAYILCLDALANISTSHTSINNTTQFLTSTTWLQLVRGLCCILKAVWPRGNSSVVFEIFRKEFWDMPLPRSKINFRKLASDMRPFSIQRFIMSGPSYLKTPNDSEIRAVLQDIRDMQGDSWNYDEDSLDDMYPISASSPYLFAIFTIMKIKSLAVQSIMRSLSLAFLFIGSLDDKFYDRFHSGDITAHRIIAEFYRVMRQFAKCNCKERWWLENLAKSGDIIVDSMDKH